MIRTHCETERTGPSSALAGDFSKCTVSIKLF